MGMGMGMGVGMGMGMGMGEGAAFDVATTEYMLLPRCRVRCQPLITRIPQVANLHRNLNSGSASASGSASGSAYGSGPGAARPTIAALLEALPPSRASLGGGSTSTGTSNGFHGRLSEGSFDPSFQHGGLGGLTMYTGKVKISNKDGQLLDAVHGACQAVSFKAAAATLTRRGQAPVDLDSNITQYQLLHQVWRTKPGVRAQRSLILTPSVAILAEESLGVIDVSLTIHGAEQLTQVQCVRLERNPLQLTFVFKASGLGVFQGRKKWRLQCGSAAVAARLLEECRKLGLPTAAPN